MSEMTMVERVARAICCPDGRCRAVALGYARSECHWTGETEEARAAIAAMRSPTRLMIMEGDYVARTAEATWHAMIDCALCEVSEEPQAHQRARQEQGGA